EEELEKGMTAGYIGFDPTADSLHIGNLVQIMTLVHFQRAGHKPFALVGGATGMVGDPSGKSQERNLLDMDTLEKNQAGVTAELKKFLDFDCGENSAQVVNNYDWFKNMGFLEFIRDVGKHASINVMLAKDSVKSRLESGMSFTEFSYQLVQGYDFFHLNKEFNCKIQCGGSDQWGNIVAGTELIRRMGGTPSFAVTTPLITKADGTKFGKTAGGAIWLNKEKTSVRAFYNYWHKASDADAVTYTRIFSLKSKEEIEGMEAKHAEDPGKQLLQKELGKELTIRVHSLADFDSLDLEKNIMFDKNIGKEELISMGKVDFENAIGSFDRVKTDNVGGNGLLNFLAGETGIYSSNGEARRALQGNAVSINKSKIPADYQVNDEDWLYGKYMIVSKGKKNHFVVEKG
ncbi:MAG: tyrosine--tRNA ligase, partial [Flavobacteriales bacterium]|nr:tyrosine--tRNA ligase [Flavobacteriales bacterium]